MCASYAANVSATLQMNPQALAQLMLASAHLTPSLPRADTAGSDALSASSSRTRADDCRGVSDAMPSTVGSKGHLVKSSRLSKS